MLHQFIARSAHRKSVSDRFPNLMRARLMQARLLGGLLGGAALIGLTPVVAQAHPGHESTNSFLTGLAHPIGGLDHLLTMVTVGLWAAQMGGRARWAVPLGFLGVMAIGGSLGQGIPAFAGTEPMILLSNLILGLCLLMAWQLPLAAGVTLVGGFALFHGLAHGAEIPVGSNGLHYALGFLLSTALLHGLGLIAGFGLQRFSPRSLRWLGAAVVGAGLCLVAAG
ncbi:MAG: hypothetical protein RLZZ511_3328 [Cyanobacteriota bacterium]|jgi:urease accessory protein